MKDSFNLLESTTVVDDPSERRARLEAPPVRSVAHFNHDAARSYQASEGLRLAINTALALEMPLLVSGEPGTGKTQSAWFLATAFGLEDPLVFPVRSTSTAHDLLYEFDAVGDFADARAAGAVNRARHVKPGPLWRALTTPQPVVLLVDEVDKAPRDFPNDLLDVLDNYRFPVPELGRLRKEVVLEQFPEGLCETAAGWFVEGAPERRRPIVVLTTNSERRLPEPFLRRCIFHHISFDRQLVERAVAARQALDFANLTVGAREAAIDAFLRVRNSKVRKKPSTAELLGWLRCLDADPDSWKQLGGELEQLPYLHALVKSQDDLKALSR